MSLLTRGKRGRSRSGSGEYRDADGKDVVPEASTHTQTPKISELDRLSGKASPAQRRRQRIRNVALGATFPILVIVLWQLSLVGSGGVSETGFIVGPLKVVTTWWDLAVSGGLWTATWASLLRVIVGVGLALAVGVPLGFLVSQSFYAGRMIYPFVEIIRPIPIPAWVPFMVLFFGIGNKPAVFLIALGAFFPVFLNTMLGARQVPKINVRAAQMLGASGYQILTRVTLPGALPSIFTGVRLAVGIGIMCVVLAELMAVRSGLGYMILEGQIQYKTGQVISGMVTLGILGGLLSKGLEYAQWIALHKWQGQ